MEAVEDDSRLGREGSDALALALAVESEVPVALLAVVSIFSEQRTGRLRAHQGPSEIAGAAGGR